jgi:surface protein
MTEEASENNRFAFTIPEYKDTNSYVFTGADGDKVKLWPERNEVIFNNGPDFETKSTYNIIMTVTNVMEQTKEIHVTVNIKDVSNDFIFEVLEGSEGSLELVINHDEQEMFNDYSFEIYKGDDENPEFDIDRSGNVAEERIVLKSLDDGMGEVQRYTIKPTSTNGLPGIKVRPNHAVVKIKVIQWGDNAWKSLNDMFSGVCFTGDAYNALSLSFSEELDAPNLSETTNMSSALSNCDLVDNLSYWDTSNAINMEKLFWLNDLGGIFEFDSSFNTDLSQWDTSSVENMARMFNGAEMFDQDISDWDVDNVTECESFKEGALLLSDVYTPDFQACSVLPSP